MSEAFTIQWVYSQKLEVLELHKHKEYIDQCVKLLNRQWPKKKEARLLSLESSCDHLPTSLILVYKSKPVGHSRISRITVMPDACMIESVMVQKKHRGKGWGKYLMQETEKYIERFRMTHIYLTTRDKVGFYEKLGYKETEPIPLFGNPLLMPSIKQMKDTLLSAKSNCIIKTTPTPPAVAKDNQSEDSTPAVAPPPPPPPPPPPTAATQRPPAPRPPVKGMRGLRFRANEKKVYMKKSIKY